MTNSPVNPTPEDTEAIKNKAIILQVCARQKYWHHQVDTHALDDDLETIFKRIVVERKYYEAYADIARTLNVQINDIRWDRFERIIWNGTRGLNVKLADLKCFPGFVQLKAEDERKAAEAEAEDEGRGNESEAETVIL